MYNAYMSNAGSTMNSIVENVTSNIPSQETFYPVIMDNDAGIIIKFSENWAKIEYHEGRIIVYRDNNGKISIIEVEYNDD